MLPLTQGGTAVMPSSMTADIVWWYCYEAGIEAAQTNSINNSNGTVLQKIYWQWSTMLMIFF